MEFTNTFEGGLNKDSNILLQPKGTYRDMNNGMLVSYDGNHYVVELPKGTTVSFTIPPIYNAVYTVDATIPTPIGFISFLDKLVVFSTNYKDVVTGGGYGEIGLVTFDKDGVGTYAPLYNHEDLNFSIFHQITGFTYEENDGIKRVYWTDYFNQPRVLNTLDPAFTAIPSGEIVSGQEYMVVGGAITYDAVVYGPGITASNIFTGTATTTFAVTDGSPVVYKYINLQLLNWSPDRTQPNIDFAGTVAGSLIGGCKQYFVRLSTADGASSGWSYGTFPINVYNIGSFSTYNFVEGTDVNSGTGVSLSITGINTYFDTIEVASAEYDQSSNILTRAIIFATEPITGSSMTINHTSEDGEALDLNDLTIFPASILKVKDMTTNKNYAIIGNITEREELTSSDTRTASIADLTYYMPADNTTGSSMNAGLPKQSSSGISSGGILFNGKYVVTGGTITYAGNVYGVGAAFGEYFTGTFPTTTYTVTSGTPVVKACILLKKYKSIAGFDKYKYIPLNDDYFDYRGMAATQYLRQYWSNEVYRIGVVPYDKKGNPMYARWIDDHTVQKLSDKGGPMNNTGNIASLKINGLRISGLTFSAEDMAKMSGFSIVRAPRDKRYYSQGILFQTVGNGGTGAGESGKIQTQPACQIGLSNDYASQRSNIDTVFNWYSPDEMFNYSGQRGKEAGGYFSGETFIKPYGALYGTAGTNNFLTKFYGYEGVESQSFKIDKYNVVDPGGSINDYYNGSIDYDNNNLHFSGFVNTLGLPDNGQAVGGRQVLVTLNGAPFFPGGTSMGASSQEYNQSKPLMNYEIPKTNLYGGQSENALANTIYISTGHYQAIDSTVLSDTFVAASGSDPDRHIFNEIDVFGGDSFLSIMSFGHSLYDDVQYSPSFSYGIFYPVESHVNPYMRMGRNIEQYGMHANPSKGIFYDISGTSRLEQYGMNDGYASDGAIFAYPALPDGPLNSNFPYRVRWAGPKTLGESTDSFREYSQNNFRDLDGNKGQINNVRNRDGKVFYWQDHGIGYLPILERVTVSGAIGEATQLGVGGVIDRFDDFNTYFGNQHKFGLTETEYGFAWFDFRRRAFLVMSVGGGVQEVSFVKGLQTFFNDRSLFYPTQLTNSGYELQDNDTPLLGIGISGVYDPMYKMTYMNFKWVEGEDEVPTFWEEFTIGYHHPRNVFVGFFDIKGAIWQSHNNWLVAAKNINSLPIAANTSYSIGNTVKKNNIEYVAITNFTTDNPISGQYQPDYVGSVYWTKTTQTNETSLLFSTTAFCKFFGYTYNSDIEFVINPKTGKPFSVDNFRHKGNDVNYDVVLCTTDDDTATESTNSKWYRYIDKSWNSSVPLGAKGRLVDFYLKVKFTLNNYTNNPTNSRNLQKLFEFITSVFREKR